MTGPPGTKYHEQADWEKSFFGNNQGEPIEFGANQCTAFRLSFYSVPTLCTQVYSCAMMLRRTGCRNGLETVSSCQFPRSSASCLLDLFPQDPVREQGPRIQRCQFRFSSVNFVTDKAKVLLYNFFKDSTATLNQWRLLLNGISDGYNFPGAPTFDETRHASICVEVCCTRPELPFRTHLRCLGWQLKFLYVAITRARNNLWIVDSSESAEPMKVLEYRVVAKRFLTSRAGILEKRGPDRGTIVYCRGTTFGGQIYC
jgi:hypothetical protein